MSFRRGIGSAAAVLIGLAAAYACTPFDEVQPVDGRPTSDAAADRGPPHDDTDDANANSSPDGSPGALQPTSCKGRLLYADGFQRNSPASEGWTAVAGDLLVLPNAGKPPPALFVSTPQLGNNAESMNSIMRTIQLDGAAGLCIELDLMVEASSDDYGDTGFSEIVTLQLSKKLYIEMQSRGLSLASGKGDNPLTTFEFGTWQHVFLRVPFNGAPVLSTADGTSTATVDDTFSPTGDTFALELGANSEAKNTGAGSCQVHIDNLIVTAPP